MAKKFHRDVWVGTVLLILCIAVFFTAVQIPGQASYLPITLSLLMGLCSVFIILKGLRLTKDQDGDFHYSMTIRAVNTHSCSCFLFLSISLASAISHTGSRHRSLCCFP